MGENLPDGLPAISSSYPTPGLHKQLQTVDQARRAGQRSGLVGVHLSFSQRSSCRTWAGPSTSACWDPAGQHRGFLPGAQRPVVGQWKDGPRGWGSGPVVQQTEEMLGDGAGE